MSEEKNEFIGYEYKDVTVKEKMENMYVDGYLNFGWELEDTLEGTPGKEDIVLKLKRDRKIRNKAELTRLQRQFEACMKEIISLENSKVIGAATVAYIVGVIGTAAMAGSVFAYIGGTLTLSIILAIPGFIGWIIPYLLFCRIRSSKSVKVEPLINKKYDEVYEVCEKANGLL